uniref:F-box and leucine rich repeat protein 6 n=1 Tax=Labrus bergylta TaxID=56723 RepID=A0A3Q3FKE0_9LABR
MDSSETQPLPSSDSREDTAPSTSKTSGHGQDAPKPKKASLKRTTGEPKNAKSKKRKKPRVSQPGYRVEQGEDMLFVISSTTSQYEGSAWKPPKKGSKKKKLAKGKSKAGQSVRKKTVRAPKPKLVAVPVEKTEKTDVTFFVPQDAMDHRWGQSVPEEVLINIFQFVVTQDGAVPFLCRVGRVCHLWNAAASSPALWRKVTIGHCWIVFKKKSFYFLFSRFSQLRDFSLYHWKKNVNYAVEVTNVTEHMVNFIHNRWYVCFQRGLCPDLELLEVNTKLDSKDCELHINIQALQMACPNLKTFRMLNVRPLLKTFRNDADSTLGFPLLEEMCIATTSYSYMTDKDLRDILSGSTRLRVLDLRGCSRITPSGLAALPCDELECLYWGQYFTSNVGSSSTKKGLHMVTEKWSRTLQQLDIANQLFTEEELEIAMSYFGRGTEADTLRSLNLSGTRITPPALRSVIGQMTSLNYLNLSSCRYLPRGMKRIYRGQEDIRQLMFDILLTSPFKKNS